MTSIRQIYVTFRKARDLESSRNLPYKAIDQLSRGAYGFCGSVLLWFLLPTRITANQMSVVGALMGTAGCVFLASPSRVSSWVGMVLIQLFVVVDFTDGALSRARNSSSTQGLVFDYLLGELVGILAFIAVGLHNMFVSRNVMYLYLGVAASLAAIMLRHVYNLKIISVLVREKDRVQEILADRSRWSDLAGPQGRSSERGWKHRIGGLTDLLWVKQYFISLLCLAYIFEVTYAFTIFYGIAFPLVFFRTLRVELTSGFEGVYRWIANSKD